jgi:hypothetical protein
VRRPRRQDGQAFGCVGQVGPCKLRGPRRQIAGGTVGRWRHVVVGPLGVDERLRDELPLRTLLGHDAGEPATEPAVVLDEFQPPGPEPELVWGAPERAGDGVADAVAGEAHGAVAREPAVHHEGPRRPFPGVHTSRDRVACDVRCVPHPGACAAPTVDVRRGRRRGQLYERTGQSNNYGEQADQSRHLSKEVRPSGRRCRIGDIGLGHAGGGARLPRADELKRCGDRERIHDQVGLRHGRRSVEDALPDPDDAQQDRDRRHDGEHTRQDKVPPRPRGCRVSARHGASQEDVSDCAITALLSERRNRPAHTGRAAWQPELSRAVPSPQDPPASGQTSLLLWPSGRAGPWGSSRSRSRRRPPTGLPDLLSRGPQFHPPW